MSSSTFSRACSPFWIAFLKCLFKFFGLFFIALGYLTPPAPTCWFVKAIYIFWIWDHHVDYDRYPLSVRSLPSHTVIFTIVSFEKQYFKFLVKPDLFIFAFCFMFSFCYHLMKFLPCSRTWNVYLCYRLEALLFYLLHLSLWLLHNVFLNMMWGRGQSSLFPCGYWITSSPLCKNTILSP